MAHEAHEVAFTEMMCMDTHASPLSVEVPLAGEMDLVKDSVTPSLLNVEIPLVGEACIGTVAVGHLFDLRIKTRRKSIVLRANSSAQLLEAVHDTLESAAEAQIALQHCVVFRGRACDDAVFTPQLEYLARRVGIAGVRVIPARPSEHASLICSFCGSPTFLVRAIRGMLGTHAADKGPVCRLVWEFLGGDPQAMRIDARLAEFRIKALLDIVQSTRARLELHCSDQKR